MTPAYDRDVGLFAPLTPFDSGYLSQDGFSIYYEQCGAPDGVPILFLHGGPGRDARQHIGGCLIRRFIGLY